MSLIIERGRNGFYQWVWSWVWYRCLILLHFSKGFGTLFHFFVQTFWLRNFDLNAICRGRTTSGLPQVLKIFVEKSILNAICRGRRYCGYLVVCLRCLILLLFVVFQSTWPFHCLHSMFDFCWYTQGFGTLFDFFIEKFLFQKFILNAICRGRTTSGF